MDPASLNCVKTSQQNILPVVAAAQDTITRAAQEVLSKYPPLSTVTPCKKFVIKQLWMYNEWSDVCQYSGGIKKHFPEQFALSPANEFPDKDLIKQVFYNVRGKWGLWGEERENAKWKKVEVAALDVEWFKANVEVCYPKEDRFEVTELKGLMLWNNKREGQSKRYKLYEGNHRVSAWLASKNPQPLPATIFIGKPRKII